MNKIIRYTLTGLATLAVLAVAALAVFAARGGFQPQESVQDTPTGSVPPGAPVAGFPAPGPGYPAWQRQNRPGPPGVPGGPAELVGEVVSLNQDNLTLFAGNGQEFMVRISEVTTVRILEGDQVGKAGDIQIGDQVRVQGLPKGPDLFEARSLVILPVATTWLAGLGT